MWEYSLLSTDVARGLRSAGALAVAWTVCLLTGNTGAAMFVATAAMNVAMPDIRGDYEARLLILGALTLLLAASTLAGTVAAGNVVAATITIGGLALLAGCWRHLSGDYGPHFALGSGLMYFIGLSQPGDFRSGLWLSVLTGLGALGGILIQIAGWFVRPQHPLRHAVAETWVAAADVIAAMRPCSDEGEARRIDLPEKEGALRATIDGTLRVLREVKSLRSESFVAHLDELTYLAARLGMRAIAFHAASEDLEARADFGAIAPTLDSALRALGNTARSAAVTIITHRAEQFIAFQVRVRRAATLVHVLDDRLAALGEAAAVRQCREMLGQILELLATMREKLDETVDHGTTSAGFALRLPDLDGLSVRSLGSWLNPARQLDPVLARYTFRAAVLLMLGVAVYEYFHIPRGYWIPFTALVVLQPDYGSTRRRAAQRISGTLAGSAVASLLLWVKMPAWALIFFASTMAFGFAYLVRSRYALAVFHVTVMIVLMTEVVMPVHLDFTIARLLSTITGGLLAFAAALLFWPNWEQDQFPGILARAMRANGRYLEGVAAQLLSGQALTGEALHAKREAERANSQATASLQRMLAEPLRRQNNVERGAVLTTHNQRLTRAITVLAQQLYKSQRIIPPDLGVRSKRLAEALEDLAREVADGPSAAKREIPDLAPPPSTTPDQGLIHEQLGKVRTEIEAIRLELRQRGG